MLHAFWMPLSCLPLPRGKQHDTEQVVLSNCNQKDGQISLQIWPTSSETTNWTTWTGHTESTRDREIHSRWWLYGRSEQRSGIQSRGTQTWSSQACTSQRHRRPPPHHTSPRTSPEPWTQESLQGGGGRVRWGGGIMVVVMRMAQNLVLLHWQLELHFTIQWLYSFSLWPLWNKLPCNTVRKMCIGNKLFWYSFTVQVYSNGKK